MAPPWEMSKARRRLPGGLTGNALFTAVIATIVSGVISFGIAHYQAQDAAGQAHAAQVADGASQIESAAVGFYEAAESLIAARKHCLFAPGNGQLPGCLAASTALVNAETVLDAAYANTSDPLTRRLLTAFSLDTHDALADVTAAQEGTLYNKMGEAYYAVIARCGQLIKGR